MYFSSQYSTAQQIMPNLSFFLYDVVHFIPNFKSFVIVGKHMKQNIIKEHRNEWNINQIYFLNPTAKYHTFK